MQPRGQISIGQLVQRLADFGHGLLAVKVGCQLGQRRIAEHQHGAGHVAQFVAAFGIWHGGVVVAGGQIRHGARQFGNRPSNDSAQQPGQHHGNADQHDPADHQRDVSDSKRRLLPGGHLCHRLGFSAAQIAQGQHGIADQHRLAGRAHLCLRLFTLTIADHGDQPVAPIGAPGDSLFARFQHQYMHGRIGQQAFQSCGFAVIFCARLVVGFEVAGISGHQIAAKLAVLAQDRRLQCQLLAMHRLAEIVAIGRTADHGKIDPEDEHHHRCRCANGDKGNAQFPGDLHRFKHRYRL